METVINLTLTQNHLLVNDPSSYLWIRRVFRWLRIRIVNAYLCPINLIRAVKNNYPLTVVVITKMPHLQHICGTIIGIRALRMGSAPNQRWDLELHSDPHADGRSHIRIISCAAFGRAGEGQRPCF